MRNIRSFLTIFSFYFASVQASICNDGTCTLDEHRNICSSDCAGLSLNAAVSNQSKGAGGFMFSLRALRDISITSFDIYSYTSGMFGVQVYTRGGTYKGHEIEQDGWYLAFDSSSVQLFGRATPRTVSLSREVIVRAGSTQSFFIYSPDSILMYNYGTQEGRVFSRDNFLEFMEGVGKTTGFSGSLSNVYRPRVYRGKIGYDAVLAPALCGDGTCQINERCPSDCDLSLKAAVLNPSRPKGSRGVMFSLNALRAVAINSLDIFSSSAGSYQVQVYTRAGTYKGAELVQAGWDLVFDDYVNMLGRDATNTISLSTQVIVQAGSTQSFFVYLPNGIVMYEYGIQEGRVFSSDDFIEFIEGVGKTTGFSGTSSNVYRPRVFAGSIGYNGSPFEFDPPTKPPTTCPGNPFTQAPTGPPNTLSYKPGENTGVSMEGDLRLSTGLLAEVIATYDQRVELPGLGPNVYSQEKFHGWPDGAGVFEKEGCDGGWYYVSNSEDGDWNSPIGGVGAIEFNRDGEVVGYRRILNDTRVNCSGGKTWWGTWVTCEEVWDGRVYEVHPENPDPSNKRKTLLGGTGRVGGKYEAVAYDRRPGALNPVDGRPRFYVTEDSSDGPLERFRPSFAAWNHAQLTGDHSNLLHDNSDGTASTDFLVIKPAFEGALMGTFHWDSDINAGFDNAWDYYSNCEGIDIRDGMLYMTCKWAKQLFILDLDAQTYVESSTVSGAFDGQPDQIKSIVNGENEIVYFCEDVGDSAGVHGRDTSGNYYTIVQDEGGAMWGETTGLAFSPDKKFMYVAYQEQGRIYKIWREDGRPFGGTRLDIKYHSDKSGSVFAGV